MDNFYRARSQLERAALNVVLEHHDNVDVVLNQMANSGGWSKKFVASRVMRAAPAGKRPWLKELLKEYL